MSGAPRRIKVLLIEDNPGDAGLVREFLLENPSDGFRVRWVADLGKARLAAAETPADQGFDVVLTDLSLPDSRGLATVRAVAGMFPELPVIVLTGLDDSQIGLQALKEGCQDYLVKGSGDPETLRRTIRYAIERKAIEQSLKESIAMFRALVEASPDAIMLVTAEAGIVLANPPARLLFALDGMPLEGRQPVDVFAEAGPVFRTRLEAVLSGRENDTTPLPWRLALEDGSRRYLETIFIPITLEGVAAVELVSRDVTARHEVEREQRLAAMLFQGTAEAMMITDRDNRIVAVNKAFETITGYSAADILGQTPGLLASGRHDAAFYAAMWEALHNEGHWHGEVWNRRKDGQIYVQRVTISLLKDESGMPMNYVGVFSDITDEKMEEDRLRHRASHDPLTGLPNRMLLQDRLEQNLAVARRQQGGLALLYIDLDGFKPVNDTLGHLAGDQLLQGVAQRFQACVRESDTVARLGGDEFVILLTGLAVESGETSAQIAGKILETLEEPFDLKGCPARVGASIGIALYPQDAATAQELMADADAAMYAAKRAGRRCYRFHSGQKF